MKNKTLLAGLAGLSILVMSGCGTVHHTGTLQTNTTSPVVVNTVTNTTATTTSNGTATSNENSKTSTTTATSTNQTDVGANTNTTTSNATASNTAASNTTASTDSNPNPVSTSSTSSNTTQTGGVPTAPLQDTMASSIQTLLNNLANPPVDCSALVQYVYAQSGISLPRIVSQQATVGKRITSVSQLQYGDVVFFDLSSQPNTPTFDGIYVGNGQFVAKTTHGTMSIAMNSGYWADKFLYGQHVY